MREHPYLDMLLVTNFGIHSRESLIHFVIEPRPQIDSLAMYKKEESYEA